MESSWLELDELVHYKHSPSSRFCYPRMLLWFVGLVESLHSAANLYVITSR